MKLKTKIIIFFNNRHDTLKMGVRVYFLLLKKRNIKIFRILTKMIK